MSWENSENNGPEINWSEEHRHKSRLWREQLKVHTLVTVERVWCGKDTDWEVGAKNKDSGITELELPKAEKWCTDYDKDEKAWEITLKG